MHNDSCCRLLLFVNQGFDEYMNIVLDEAAEVNTKTNKSVPIGEALADLRGLVSAQQNPFAAVSYFCFVLLLRFR